MVILEVLSHDRFRVCTKVKSEIIDDLVHYSWDYENTSVMSRKGLLTNLHYAEIVAGKSMPFVQLEFANWKVNHYKKVLADNETAIKNLIRQKQMISSQLDEAQAEVDSYNSENKDEI